MHKYAPCFAINRCSQFCKALRLGRVLVPFLGASELQIEISLFVCETSVYCVSEECPAIDSVFKVLKYIVNREISSRFPFPCSKDLVENSVFWC